MFPLKSLIPTKGFPFVTWILIFANVGIFYYIWDKGLSSVYYLDWGIVPAKLGMPKGIIPFYEKIMPFFSYMFVHGGWFHLISNVYFLYIFGNGVEAKLGHGR